MKLQKPVSHFVLDYLYHTCGDKRRTVKIQKLSHCLSVSFLWNSSSVAHIIWHSHSNRIIKILLNRSNCSFAWNKFQLREVQTHWWTHSMWLRSWRRKSHELMNCSPKHMFCSDTVVLTYLVIMTLRVQGQFLSELIKYSLWLQRKFISTIEVHDIFYQSVSLGF